MRAKRLWVSEVVFAAGGTHDALVAHVVDGAQVEGEVEALAETLATEGAVEDLQAHDKTLRKTIAKLNIPFFLSDL